MGRILSYVACARASSDELLGAIFDPAILDRLHADCHAAVEKSGGIRGAICGGRMLTQLSKGYGDPSTFAETLDEFNRRLLLPRGGDAAAGEVF